MEERDSAPQLPAWAGQTPFWWHAASPLFLRLITLLELQVHGIETRPLQF